MAIDLAPEPPRGTRKPMSAQSAPNAASGEATPKTLQTPPARKAFVVASAVALALFILLQTWSAIQARGPGGRLRELMPAIGAQLVDRELPADLAALTLEGAPQQGGVPFRLADVPPGTTVFLNFWATWCEPCRRELPSMRELRRRMAGRPFLMVAVSYDEDWATIADFFNKTTGGLPRELLLARDPATDEAQMMRTRLGTRRLPETYVIRDGRVLARFVNERDWTDPQILAYFEGLTEPR